MIKPLTLEATLALLLAERRYVLREWLRVAEGGLVLGELANSFTNQFWHHV